MPPKTRKRKAEVAIIKVEEAPWGRQTPTDRKNPTKYSTSTMSIQRQETLTQIGWIQSPQPEDEIDDLEYEEDSIGPPVEPIRPKPRQPRKERRKRFPPQKETLTQGGFILPYHEQEKTDFDIEEEQFRERSTSSSRKRAKLAKEEPLAREIQTRSVRRRAAQERYMAVDIDDTTTASPRPCSVQRQESEQPKIPMLPPKTPQISRTREIPSSQSPSDTPLSTQNRRSWTTQIRSPLQERSPNIRQAALSAKRTLFPSKLEIADTFDSVDEVSQTPTVAKAVGEVFIGGEQLHDLEIPVNDLKTSKSDVRQGSIQLRSQISTTLTRRVLAESNQDPVITGRQADTSHANHERDGTTINRQGKSEILDSEDEETQSPLDDDDFPAGVTAQAACSFIPSSSPNESKDESQPVLRTEKPMATEEDSYKEVVDSEFNGDQNTEDNLVDNNVRLPSQRTPRIPSNASGFSTEAKIYSAEDMQPYTPAASPDEDARSHKNRAVGELSIPEFNDQAISHNPPSLSLSNHSNVTMTPEHPRPHHLNTDIVQASRPNHKPDLSPKGFAPETESQFDNAWRPFSPPPQLSPFSSSPSHISPNDPSTPSPASPFKHPLLATQTLPMPPSQATTVDITQRTQPQLPLPLARDFSSSSTKKPSRRFRSPSTSLPPPPPAPPLSSSPLLTRKSPHKDSLLGMGGMWDGRRLTDSQLLPDSLMNDSFVGPPGWELMGSDGMEYEEE